MVDLAAIGPPANYAPREPRRPNHDAARLDAPPGDNPGNEARRRRSRTMQVRLAVSSRISATQIPDFAEPASSSSTAKTRTAGANSDRPVDTERTGRSSLFRRSQAA